MSKKFVESVERGARIVAHHTLAPALDNCGSWGDGLVEALKENWIAGAALDVFEDEPIPLESPLNRLDNLLMTAHTAGLTVEARKELSVSAASQILQVLRGNKPKHLVNSNIWRPIVPLI